MKKPMIRSDLCIKPAFGELGRHLYDAGQNLCMAALYVLCIPVAAVAMLWLPERSAKRDIWNAKRASVRFEDT